VAGFVGLRYTRARRRDHFIAFNSLNSMLGIALGVTALITVLSVMNGFERELRQRILGMASHATISGPDGRLRDWQPLLARAARHDQVIGLAPYVEGQAMLVHRGRVRGTWVRGVLPEREPEVSEVGELLESGHLADLVPGQYRILLGAGLAGALGAYVGSRVVMVAPQARVTPAGVLPRVRRFTVAGIFRVNHGQYDTGLAVVNVRDGARVFQLADSVTGLRLKLVDMFSAPQISRELARSLGGTYRVSDWTSHHANFFKALRLEKTVMFVILTLIVAVAAFNLVSTLIMVVTEKRSDIAVLRTMGASPGSIMGIFIVQGTVIGLVGTLLGLAGGVALASYVETLVPTIERLFETRFLSPEVYYISEVPSDLRWRDVGITGSLALVLAVLATVYPAWRAARTQPAEALRYE